MPNPPAIELLLLDLFAEGGADPPEGIFDAPARLRSSLPKAYAPTIPGASDIIAPFKPPTNPLPAPMTASFARPPSADAYPVVAILVILCQTRSLDRLQQILLIFPLRVLILVLLSLLVNQNYWMG